MNLVNPQFAIFFILAVAPLVIYFIRRFLMPHKTVASTVYLEDHPHKRRFPIDRQFLQALLQTLIFLTLVAAFAGLGCGQSQDNGPGRVIAIYDDRYVTALQRQGQNSPWEETRRYLNKLGNPPVYLLSQIAAGNDNPQPYTGGAPQPYNDEYYFFQNFTLFEKTLSDTFKSKLTIHFFSGFCHHGIPGDKPAAEHQWFFYPVSPKNAGNLYVSRLQLRPDPRVADRSFLTGRIDGPLESVQKPIYQLFIGETRRRHSPIPADGRLRIPLETAGGRLTGYIRILGDDLDFDNDYFFNFKAQPAIRLVLKGTSQEKFWPVLKSALQPNENDTRFQLWPLDSSMPAAGALQIHYGGPGFGPKTNIWMYDGQSLPTQFAAKLLAQEKAGGNPVMVDDGVDTTRATAMGFSRFLTAPPGLGEVLYYFESGEPAVIQTGPGRVLVLFDPLSAAGPGIFHIDYPFLLHAILYDTMPNAGHRIVSGRAQMLRASGQSPARPGLYGDKDNPWAYNAAIEAAVCSTANTAELLAALPGQIAGEEIQRAFLSGDVFGFWLTVALFFTLGYTFLFRDPV